MCQSFNNWYGILVTRPWNSCYLLMNEGPLGWTHLPCHERCSNGGRGLLQKRGGGGVGRAKRSHPRPLLENSRITLCQDKLYNKLHGISVFKTLTSVIICVDSSRAKKVTLAIDCHSRVLYGIGLLILYVDAITKGWLSYKVMITDIIIDCHLRVLLWCIVIFYNSIVWIDCHTKIL